MKYFPISARLSVIFAVAAGLGLGGAMPAPAFTLAETLFLPAVLLQASQPIDAFVKISNVSANDVELFVDVYDVNGRLIKAAGSAASPITVVKSQTFSLKIPAPPTGTKNVHTIIGVGTANAVVGDLLTVDNSTGQMIAVVPAGNTLPSGQFLER